MMEKNQDYVSMQLKKIYDKIRVIFRHLLWKAQFFFFICLILCRAKLILHEHMDEGRIVGNAAVTYR